MSLEHLFGRFPQGRDRTDEREVGQPDEIRNQVVFLKLDVSARHHPGCPVGDLQLIWQDQQLQNERAAMAGQEQHRSPLLRAIPAMPSTMTP